MIKPTKKQLIEIDFLSKCFTKKFIPTEEEISDYLERTVFGKRHNYNNIYDEKNRLFLNKRNLDILIKDWAKDIKEGILSYSELLANFNNHAYIIKVIKTMKKNIK